MVLGRGMIAAPAVVTVRFEYSPVMALINGLLLRVHEESVLDGTDRTLQNLIATLPPERKEIHSRVFGIFCNAIPYVGDMSFPDFLKHFATLDATELRAHAT